MITEDKKEVWQTW